MNSLQEYSLGELLPYEQPTPYIVESTDYNDNYKTPVLTAGKSFIIGYTNELNGIYDKVPVIIFDDFTTSTQYVNFPFKVKSSAMKILTANTDLVLPKFIFYRMQLIEFDHSTHKRYWIQQYSKIRVKIPPLPEQKRIVARIEELFSELDNGVETLKKTKQQLAVYRQSVLKAAFEGRLTRTYRETKGFEKWEMVPITAVIAKNKNALKAGPFGSALKKDCYVPSGYKVYGQEQVIAGDETIGNYYINKKKYEELSSCAVAPEDVLISLVGTVGKVLVLSDACLPGIINPRLIKVTLDATKMLPLFFKYYFESAYLKSLYKEKAHGATMDVLNMGMIKELPFPFCNVKEQRQVIAEIESRLSVCDSIEKTVDAALQQSESMRQSILKKAFEGKL